MGAWGSGNFENDEASDWLNDFCDSPDEERILNALLSVTETDEDEYLELPDCSIGLAAAEVVAALNDAPNAAIPDEVKVCVSELEMELDANMVSSALLAIERIKTNSELKELWDESEDADQWYAALADLETRLKQ